MDFQCVYCNSFCPTSCYPTHRQAFSCHNTHCAGHKPVPTPHLFSPHELHPSMRRGAYVQWQEGKPNRLVGGQDRLAAAADNAQPAPLPLPPPPPHIQYFLHGIRSPRDRGNHRNHDGSPTRRPKAHEYRKGRWRASQAGPAWNESTVQMLRDQPSISRIKRGLYVGNLACVDTPGFLESMKITSVVSVLSRRRGGHPSHPLHSAIPFEDQLFLKVRDECDQDILQHFPGVCDFMDKRLVRSNQSLSAPAVRLSLRWIPSSPSTHLAFKTRTGWISTTSANYSYFVVISQSVSFSTGRVV